MITSPKATRRKRLRSSTIRGRSPQLSLVADQSLNAANEISSQILTGLGLTAVTSACDLNFEQLAANVLSTAVDVILLDPTFWGGIRACVKAALVVV